MRKRFTSWAKFRAYVGSHNTGDLITRKNIIEELDGVPHSTIDMFRRVCEKNNILVKMEEFTQHLIRLLQQLEELIKEFMHYANMDMQILMLILQNIN